MGRGCAVDRVRREARRIMGAWKSKHRQAGIKQSKERRLKARSGCTCVRVCMCASVGVGGCVCVCVCVSLPTIQYRGSEFAVAMSSSHSTFSQSPFEAQTSPLWSSDARAPLKRDSESIAQQNRSDRERTTLTCFLSNLKTPSLVSPHTYTHNYTYTHINTHVNIHVCTHLHSSIPFAACLCTRRRRRLV